MSGYSSVREKSKSYYEDDDHIILGCQNFTEQRCLRLPRGLALSGIAEK